MIRVIQCIALLVLLVGCNRDPATSSEVRRSNSPKSGAIVGNTATVKGVRITAEGPSVTVSHSSSPEREIVEIGEHIVELQGSELKINGQSYGSVSKGEEVKVTPDGAVFVNGKLRSPQ